MVPLEIYRAFYWRRALPPYWKSGVLLVGSNTPTHNSCRDLNRGDTGAAGDAGDRGRSRSQPPDRSVCIGEVTWFLCCTILVIFLKLLKLFPLTGCKISWNNCRQSTCQHYQKSNALPALDWSVTVVSRCLRWEQLMALRNLTESRKSPTHRCRRRPTAHGRPICDVRHKSHVPVLSPALSS